MNNSPKSKRLIWIRDALFSIFLLIFLLVALSGCGSNSSDIKINATVYYSDVQDFFTIINNNDFTWDNVILFLNYEDDDLSSGYRYDVKGPTRSGSMEIIEDWKFTNSDGSRYTHQEPQPFKLLVQAETLDGKKGQYLKTWE